MTPEDKQAWIQFAAAALLNTNPEDDGNEYTDAEWAAACADALLLELKERTKPAPEFDRKLVNIPPLEEDAYLCILMNTASLCHDFATEAVHEYAYVEYMQMHAALEHSHAEILKLRKELDAAEKSNAELALQIRPTHDG